MLLWLSSVFAIIALIVVTMNIDYTVLTATLICLCAMFVCLSIVAVAWTIDEFHTFRLTDYLLTAAIWGAVVGVGILIVDMLFKIAYTQVGCITVYTELHDISLAGYATLIAASASLVLLIVIQLCRRA